MARPKSGPKQPGGANAPRFYKTNFGWFDAQTRGVSAGSQAELIQKIGRVAPHTLSPSVIGQQMSNAGVTPVQPEPVKAVVNKTAAKPVPGKKPVAQKDATRGGVRVIYNTKAEMEAAQKKKAEAAAKDAAERKAQRIAALEDDDLPKHQF